MVFTNEDGDARVSNPQGKGKMSYSAGAEQWCQVMVTSDAPTGLSFLVDGKRASAIDQGKESNYNVF